MVTESLPGAPLRVGIVLNVASRAARGARPSWGFASGEQCSLALPFAFRTARDEVAVLPDFSNWKSGFKE